MQIITRVLVSSATFPNFLLVAATNAALFRGPFLINAAKMLVGRIQCGGNSFTLNPLVRCTSMCVPLYSSSLLGALKEGYLCQHQVFPIQSLECRGHNHPQQYLQATRILFVCPRQHTSSAWALGPSIKWAGLVRFLGPTIYIHTLFVNTA